MSSATITLDARDILTTCRKYLPDAVESQIAEEDQRAGGRTHGIGDRLAIVTARHTSNAELCTEAAPWAALAAKLGEDGTQPLPDEITDEQATHVLNVAARHMLAAQVRIVQRAAAWPRPDADWHTLAKTGVELVLAQQADAHFVATLTTPLPWAGDDNPVERVEIAFSGTLADAISFLQAHTESQDQPTTESASPSIKHGGWKYDHEIDGEDFAALTATELRELADKGGYDFSDHPAMQE